MARETLYLLVVLACVWFKPAFLLVDVGASVRDPQIGYSFLAVYVLMNR